MLYVTLWRMSELLDLLQTYFFALLTILHMMVFRPSKKIPFYFSIIQFKQYKFNILLDKILNYYKFQAIDLLKDSQCLPFKDTDESYHFLSSLLPQQFKGDGIPLIPLGNIDQVNHVLYYPSDNKIEVLEKTIEKLFQMYIDPIHNENIGFIKVDDLSRLWQYFKEELVDEDSSCQSLIANDGLYANMALDHLYQLMKLLIRIFAVDVFNNFFLKFSDQINVYLPVPDLPDRTLDKANKRRDSIFSVCLRYESKNKQEINKIYSIIGARLEEDKIVACDTEGNELSAKTLMGIYHAEGPSF